MKRTQKSKLKLKSSIFQDSDKYRRESYWERVRDLRSLTLEKSAKIVEEIVTCQLGKEIIEANKKWSKK
jgi:hypothetical protein